MADTSNQTSSSNEAATLQGATTTTSTTGQPAQPRDAMAVASAVAPAPAQDDISRTSSDLWGDISYESLFEWPAQPAAFPVQPDAVPSGVQPAAAPPQDDIFLASFEDLWRPPRPVQPAAAPPQDDDLILREPESSEESDRGDRPPLNDMDDSQSGMSSYSGSNYAEAREMRELPIHEEFKALFKAYVTRKPDGQLLVPLVESLNPAIREENPVDIMEALTRKWIVENCDEKVLVLVGNSEEGTATVYDVTGGNFSEEEASNMALLTKYFWVWPENSPAVRSWGQARKMFSVIENENFLDHYFDIGKYDFCELLRFLSGSEDNLQYVVTNLKAKDQGNPSQFMCYR